MIRPTLRLLASAVALTSASALAGPLATDATVYVDGSGAWHGSTPYQGHDNLGNASRFTGYIDWAVYAPGTAPAGLANTVPPQASSSTLIKPTKPVPPRSRPSRLTCKTRPTTSGYSRRPAL